MMHPRLLLTVLPVVVGLEEAQQKLKAMEKALQDPLLGANVVLRNVHAKRELEGKAGVVTSLAGHRKYVVKMDDHSGVFTVKASNLEVQGKIDRNSSTANASFTASGGGAAAAPDDSTGNLFESSFAQFNLVFSPIPTLFNGLRTATTSPGNSAGRSDSRGTTL